MCRPFFCGVQGREVTGSCWTVTIPSRSAITFQFECPARPKKFVLRIRRRFSYGGQQCVVLWQQAVVLPSEKRNEVARTWQTERKHCVIMA